MTFEKHIFRNGLRLLSVPLKNTEAVTCLVLVGTGSRYENENNAGVSHFLEHMFFKGAKRYPTVKDVSGTIDAVGGDFNAFTGKEYTGYYIKTAKEHLELSMDILSDMLLNATLPATEMEKERLVIAEEINMYEDMPAVKIEEDFELLMFGKTDLGRNIAGYKETVAQMTRETLSKYRQGQYVPNNIIVVLSGALPKTGTEDLVGKYFDFAENASSEKFKPHNFTDEASSLLKIVKPTEQAHLVLGVPACSSRDKAKFATQLLSIILGGNMSSRMFLKVRDEKGLCYYVSTEHAHYLDAGFVATRAGVDLRRIQEAITAIKDEYFLAAKEGFTEAELKKAKDFIHGKTILRMEDSEALANLIGNQELLYNEALTPEELLKKYDTVSLKEINQLAKNLFAADKLKLAIIGPEKELASIDLMV